MNSSNLLARNARKYPKNEAVICHGRRMNYRDLDEQVTRFSHALLEQGVKQGDKVLIFMPNTLEFVVSYFAIQRIGAIVVPVNAKFTLLEVEYVAQHAEAKAIVVHEAIYTAVQHLATVLIKIKTGSEKVGWLHYETMIQNASIQPIDCQVRVRPSPAANSKSAAASVVPAPNAATPRSSAADASVRRPSTM